MDYYEVLHSFIYQTLNTLRRYTVKNENCIEDDEKLRFAQYDFLYGGCKHISILVLLSLLLFTIVLGASLVLKF